MESTPSIEIIINLSKSIESILEKKFQATGKGLHSKLSSVDFMLPEDLTRKVRWIATVRNKAVHEENFSLQEIPNYESEANYIIEELTKIPNITFSSIDISKFEQIEPLARQYSLRAPLITQDELNALNVPVFSTSLKTEENSIFYKNLTWRTFLLFIAVIVASSILKPLVPAGVSPYIMVIMALIVIFIFNHSENPKPIKSIEPYGTKLCTDQDTISEISKIKEQNPIVKSYLLGLGKMDRKLVNDEADLLIKFHEWAVREEKRQAMQKTEENLYY